MKNQPAEEEQAEHTSVDELEQIVIEAPQQLAFPDSQLETESAEDKKEDESGNAFVKPEQLINIKMCIRDRPILVAINNQAPDAKRAESIPNANTSGISTN